MPKIIENLQSKLIQAARKQTEEVGYSAMTVRSVAKECGVGVGTVYNYFPSKDALLASYMLSDWQQCIADVNALSAGSESPAAVVRCAYDQLIAFSHRHRAVLTDKSAAASLAGSFSRYHALLRDQLAAPVRKFCKDDFASAFIAEALLTWTMAGNAFDEIYGMLQKLF